MPRKPTPTLCYHCNEYKMKTRRNTCIECHKEHLQNETKRCSSCRTVKKWEYFCSSARLLFGRKNICRQCQSVEGTQKLKEREPFLKRMLYTCRSNNNTRNARGRHLEFTWTYEQMVAKLAILEDKCAVSGLPMSFRTHSNWKCSPERIDNNIGYIDSNMTFVCLEFQLGYGHQATTALVQYLCSIETRSHPRIAEIASGQFTEKKWLPHCHLGQRKCKLCVSSYGKDYRNTTVGKINQVVNKTNENTVARNLKGRNHGESEMDFASVMTLLQSQKGLCYLTGHHLGFESGAFNCISIERNNVALGYIKGNCCLIMQGLNTTDCSARKSLANVHREGSGAWSREKIDYLRRFTITQSLASATDLCSEGQDCHSSSK